MIIYDTLHQQDKKNLVAKNCKIHRVRKLPNCWTPNCWAPLNSVKSSFKSKKEGRVTTVVAKARYQRATKNQTKQRFKHCARSRPSNTIIKVLLDSGPDGDIIFQQEHPYIPPT